MKTYGLYLPIIAVIALTALWLMRGHQEINALQAAIVVGRELRDDKYAAIGGQLKIGQLEVCRHNRLNLLFKQ